MGTRVLGTFPPVGDWRSRSSTGLLEVDLQSVTVTKITRTGVDWRYCTASTPQPWVASTTFCTISKLDVMQTSKMYLLKLTSHLLQPREASVAFP